MANHKDVVLLDANIFYPAPMRDIFLQLAVTDIFRGRWTADIHREWMDALLRAEPERDRAKLERTRKLMDQATRDALIIDYESLIPDLTLPDADDRHVLAAAIVGECNVIVTQNLKDFPAEILAVHGIKAWHPDVFLHHHLQTYPGIFCEAVKTVRTRLKNPPYSVEDYLATLKTQGLVKTVAELERFLEQL